MVDGLLHALGLVAFWNEWAFKSGVGAGFNSGGLGEGLIVGLDMVDNDSPVPVDVDCTEGLDVGGVGGAEVGLLDDFIQTVNAVVGVGQDVLVHLLDSVVVVLEGLLDFIGWVFLVFKTPWAGVAGSAGGWAVGWGWVSVGWLGLVWWGWPVRSRCRCIRWGSGAVPVWWWGRCVWSWGVRSWAVG